MTLQQSQELIRRMIRPYPHQRLTQAEAAAWAQDMTDYLLELDYDEMVPVVIEATKRSEWRPTKALLERIRATRLAEKRSNLSDVLYRPTPEDQEALIAQQDHLESLSDVDYWEEAKRIVQQRREGVRSVVGMGGGGA